MVLIVVDAVKNDKNAIDWMKAFSSQLPTVEEVPCERKTCGARGGELRS